MKLKNTTDKRIFIAMGVDDARDILKATGEAFDFISIAPGEEFDFSSIGFEIVDEKDFSLLKK